MAKFNSKWSEAGFEERTFKAMTRVNGKWLQIVTLNEKGEERFWIMQKVDTLLDRKQRSSAFGDLE